jgi:catechol 2,3-dioxygenase-like lactoylglutathione lyase family enzyme
MKRELDHVGVAVLDLDRGRDVFRRLGFRLTARSFHSGSPTPGAPVERWGSGNHCAMFQQGYLEIIGLTDPALYSSVRDMVARYEGLHIVAIGCGDAQAAQAELMAAGAPVESFRSLEREAAFGPHDESTRRAAFRNIYVDRQKFPEARLLFIEHLTPEVLWQPHLLEHPNGAIRIDAVHLVVPDPRASCDKFAPLFSSKTRHSPGESHLDLDRGTMSFVTEARWRERVPGRFLPPLPSPAGFSISVVSLAQTRNWLAGQGVPVRDALHDDGVECLWLAAEDACGAAIQFRQAADA